MRWRDQYRLWPDSAWRTAGTWRSAADGGVCACDLARDLRRRSPPTADGPRSFLVHLLRHGEGRLDGGARESRAPLIVNRFPYVLALSFCRHDLSSRHHARGRFMDLLERSGQATVQFLPQGEPLDRAMSAIATAPDRDTHTRIRRSTLTTRGAVTNDAPVFDDAYLVYEASLARPSLDFSGGRIYDTPGGRREPSRLFPGDQRDPASRRHRGRTARQIHWRSLPAWQPQRPLQTNDAARRSGG
jgi:hypothetical protein